MHGHLNVKGVLNIFCTYTTHSNGKLPPRTWPGCSVPEPYRSHDWALVPAKPGLQGWILMNTTHQQMHSYNYVQLHIISLLHRHVSITTVIIIRGSCNKKTMNKEIIIQKCMTKLIDITLHFSVAFTIIIINIKDWTLWSVPSPELQLLAPILLRSYQFCASSGDSDLGRVSSGWITSPSLSKFGGG